MSCTFILPDSWKQKQDMYCFFGGGSGGGGVNFYGVFVLKIIFSRIIRS